MDSSEGRDLALGIDFGGTGIKTALIYAGTGELISNRLRMTTPNPATPDAVAGTIVKLIANVAKEHAIPDGTPIGLGLPGVVKNGVVNTAANIDKAWIGASAEDVVGTALGRRVYAMNDADAAGLAEVRLGAGRDVRGTVLLLTVGTGIGSGLFYNGKLIPNTELGHIEVNGRDAETRISGAARERRRLRWKSWALEFNEYLARVESYLWPDLIVLGGGVSKVIDKYRDQLKSRAPIEVAQFRNTSGIIGAAIHATERTRDARLESFQDELAAARAATTAHEDDAAAESEPTPDEVQAASDRLTSRTLQVHLLDATYELFRSHFAPRPQATDPHGHPINATVGVIESTLYLFREEGVTHLGCASDHIIESWRNDRYAGYKTGAGVDPQLKRQFSLAEEALECPWRRRLAVGRIRGRRRLGHCRCALGEGACSRACRDHDSGQGHGPMRSRGRQGRPIRPAPATAYRRRRCA